MPNRASKISGPINSSVYFLVFGLFVGVCFQNFYVGFSVAIFGISLLFVAERAELAHVLDVSIAVSFSVGIIAAIVLYFGYINDYGIPYWLPGLDDKELENDAYQCVEKGYVSVYDMVNGDTPRERQHNAKGYVILLSYLIRLGEVLGGYHTFVPRALNIFALNLVGIFAVKILVAEGCKLGKGVKTLYLVLTLFPNMVYIGAHVYRDMLAALLLVLAYVAASGIAKRKSTVYCVLALCLMFYCAYWIRSMLIVFMAGIVIVVLLAKKADNEKGRLTVSKVALLLAGICAVIFLLFRFGEEAGSYVSFYGNALTSGDNALVSIIYAIPIFPLGIVLRMVAYLCTPYYYGVVYDMSIWFSSTTNIAYVILSMGTVFLVSHYVYAIRGAKADKGIFFCTLIVLVGIVATTYGYRHVVMLYPFLFMLLYRGRVCVLEDDNAKRQYGGSAIALGSLFVAAFGLMFIF